MSKQKIFPEAVIKQSTNQLYFDTKTKSKIIYLSVLLFIVIAFIALFFIRVDISVSATGAVKPQGERNVITSPYTGRVAFVNAAENKRVKKGDTLFIVKSENITAQMPALNSRQRELRLMLADLSQLSAGNALSLQSPVYIRAYGFYKAQLHELQIKEQAAKRDYDRNKQLFDKQIIAATEFEQYQNAYDNAKIALQVLHDKYAAQWSSDKSGYQSELHDIETSISKIDIQSDETVVRAPVDGTIQSLNNVLDGTYVQTGQTILEISPDGQLFVECYISPKDIGYVKVGQKGRIQIAAFNYNDWGMLDGTVAEIFDDIVTSGDQSAVYYKIYCSLNRDYLQLKNGMRGYVKKGMTAQVRFIVTSRTLFQLLYDKVDDWLNPNQMEN